MIKYGGLNNINYIENAYDTHTEKTKQHSIFNNTSVESNVHFIIMQSPASQKCTYND